MNAITQSINFISAKIALPFNVKEKDDKVQAFEYEVNGGIQVYVKRDTDGHLKLFNAEGEDTPIKGTLKNFPIRNNAAGTNGLMDRWGQHLKKLEIGFEVLGVGMDYKYNQ